MSIADLLFDNESHPTKRRAKGWVAVLVALVPALAGAIGSYYTARGEAHADASAAYEVLRDRQQKLVEAVATLKEEMLRQRIAELEGVEAQREAEADESARRHAAVRRRGGARRPAPEPEPPAPAALPELNMPEFQAPPVDLEAARQEVVRKKAASPPELR